MKKASIILTVFLMLGLILVACGGGEAEAFIKYLLQELGDEYMEITPYLAMLSADNNWASSYATSVRQAAQQYAPDLIVQHILVDFTIIENFSNFFPAEIYMILLIMWTYLIIYNTVTFSTS